MAHSFFMLAANVVIVDFLLIEEKVGGKKSLRFGVKKLDAIANVLLVFFGERFFNL